MATVFSQLEVGLRKNAEISKQLNGGMAGQPAIPQNVQHYIQFLFKDVYFLALKLVKFGQTLTLTIWYYIYLL